MKRVSYLLYSSICIYLSGCRYDYIEFAPTEPTVEVSYKEHIVPIFEKSCIVCHNGQLALPNLTGDGSYSELIDGGYINTTDIEESKLIIKLNDNHPYAGTPLSSEKDLISQWITEGALNN